MVELGMYGKGSVGDSKCWMSTTKIPPPVQAVCNLVPPTTVLPRDVLIHRGGGMIWRTLPLSQTTHSPKTILKLLWGTMKF